MKKLLTVLTIAISFSAYSQFEDKKFVVAGGFSFSDNFSVLNPSVGFVLNEKQLIGSRALFVFGDDDSDFQRVSVWFRHHFSLSADFPLYLYLEPELAYVDAFDGLGLAAVNTGFSIPFTKTFMLNLRAAGLTVLFGDESDFNLSANNLAAEFMVRF